MDLKLVLTSSPVSLSERYGKFCGAANTEPSYGLVCLASVAQRVGANVLLVEASAENLSIDKTLRRILEFEPDAVGLTATSMGIEAAGQLAERLKLQNSRLVNIIGGCHATALPKETLQTYRGFDLAVIGEGERTLVEILKRLAEKQTLPMGMKGTAERNREEITIHPPRPRIENLDELPLPAWSLLRGFPTAFHPSIARAGRWPCASVVLSRGCPNYCTFCDRSVFGRKCRAYSPSYAVELIKELRYTYGVKEILIEDDTFFISQVHLRELCERLLADKVDVTWSCLGRADCVDLDLLTLMRRAGCRHISYGIESGAPLILKAMNKQLGLEHIRKAVEWTKTAGIRTKGFFIVGFPGETPETLKASREFAKSLSLDDISVMPFTPFPGSELYAVADRYGEFEGEWRKMNLVNTVFIPQGFTKEDIESAQIRMIREFYLRPGIIVRQFVHLLKHPRAALAIFLGVLTSLRAVIFSSLIKK